MGDVQLGEFFLLTCHKHIDAVVHVAFAGEGVELDGGVSLQCVAKKWRGKKKLSASVVRTFNLPKISRCSIMVHPSFIQK
jgi:hypothetical protein